QLASQLWGDGDGRPFRKTVGRGVVIGGVAMDEVLKKEGIAPDFEGPFQYTHRRAAGTDIYFVAGEGTAECTFRVRGLEPEFWNPVTGRFHRAESYRKTADGRMVTTVSLPKYGSVFVVFRKRALPAQRRPLAEPKQPVTPLELTGPWNVRFAPGWGAPESETFATLTPWNENALDGIKYFSGTATYRKTVTLTAAQVRKPALILSLGEVKHIASVRLNGKSLGIVWTTPWTVNLAGAAKAGENVLEIDVTNVWVNRLIGDAGLPEAKRFTKTHVRREPGVQYPRPNLRGYLATDPLVRSGLMGPVTIEFADRDTTF
ncbi:MAG: glycosylhydrolase-like jelly roll fold domain-containing protein, partial [Bryobacteraceae bacterium]